MLGLGEAEDDESIIPSDAEPVEGINAPSGIKLDQDKFDDDRTADEPSHPMTPDEDSSEELLTPRDALVAPDVTPEAMEPIDPSEVPAPKGVPQPVPQPAPPSIARQDVNPMDVLLGRTSSASKANQALPEEPIVTAESAQATVNTVLGIHGGSGDGLLKQGQSMPDPTPAQSGKIMETFYKYGPKRTSF